MDQRDDIDAIRRSLADPKDVAQRIGRDAGSRRQSGGVWIRCVAHDDRGRPNLSLTSGPDGTLRARCFSCGFTGDVLTLIAAVEGIDADRDFPAVLERARALAGIVVDTQTSTPRPKPMTMQTPPPPRLPTLEFAEMMRPLQRLGLLGSCQDARAYLEQRRLLAEATADGWFAVATAAGRLLTDAFGDRARLTGLLDHSGDLTHPANRLAIPWRSPSGAVDTIQRRRIDAETKQKYVFPNQRGAAWPYGIERLPPTADEFVIVEGAMDTLARRHLDALPVVGIPGVSWSPAEGWAALVTGRTVRVSFDADEAGDREAAKLATMLYEAGAVRVRRERPVGAKDWADLWAQEARAA